MVSQIPSQGPAGLEKSKSKWVGKLDTNTGTVGNLENARYVSIWREMEVAAMF